MIGQLLKSKAVIYIIIAILAFLVLGGILRKIGIFKSQSKRQKQTAKGEQRVLKIVSDSSLLKSNSFNPNFYKSFKKTPADFEKSKRLATDLRKSMKGWGTNESKLFATMDGLTSRSDISLVSHAYAEMYKRSLINDILSELSKSDRIKLFQTIKDLPNN